MKETCAELRIERGWEVGRPGDAEMARRRETGERFRKKGEYVARGGTEDTIVAPMWKAPGKPQTEMRSGGFLNAQ
ncbi:MAG: hypothetical protein ABSC23_05680 [Bryobacteraceae bacterium]|jgi:hypothetical protein